MIPRKDILVELPFREILSKDADQEFYNELFPKNRVDLSFLADKNTHNRHVLVYDFDGKVLGFMTFLDMGDHFHLDLVENNRLFHETALYKPGSQFIMLLDGVSREFGYGRITLNSVQDRVLYYEKHGFEISGASYADPSYGLQMPMTKQVI